MEDKKVPSCCVNNKDSPFKGILFGLVPHVGCMLFIVGAVLGSVFLTELFKPLLTNSYFFYALIGTSLLLATVSSFVYLRNRDSISWEGVRREWKYLSIMYGSAIGVNLLMYGVIFPMLLTTPLQVQQTAQGVEKMNLLVDIPCSGHAVLVIQELKKLEGIKDVQFIGDNKFTVSYDTNLTNKEKILGIDLFKEFNAKEV